MRGLSFQIAGNLRKFGSSETDTSVVVVIFNKTDEEVWAELSSVYIGDVGLTSKAMKTVPIKGDIQPLAALSEQDNKMSVAKVIIDLANSWLILQGV